MMCPYCDHILFIRPDKDKVAERPCAFCGAVLAVYVVSPPQVSDEKVVEIRNRNT